MKYAKSYIQCPKWENGAIIGNYWYVFSVIPSQLASQTSIYIYNPNFFLTTNKLLKYTTSLLSLLSSDYYLVFTSRLLYFLLNKKVERWQKLYLRFSQQFSSSSLFVNRVSCYISVLCINCLSNLRLNCGLYSESKSSVPLCCIPLVCHFIILVGIIIMIH